MVLSSLNLSSAHEMQTFRTRNESNLAKVIESVDEERVRFVPTLDNTKRSRVYKEEIHLDSIASLMAAARE